MKKDYCLVLLSLLVLILLIAGCGSGNTHFDIQLKFPPETGAGNQTKEEKISYFVETM